MTLTPPDEDKARSWAKTITVVGGAIILLIGPAVTAYKLAAIEARDAAGKVAASTVKLAAETKIESQATKNEAEAGYQVLLREVEALRAEKVAREHARPGKRRRTRPSAPPVALPTDLKKAEAIVYSNTAPQVQQQAPVIVPMARPDATQSN